jgi:GNAT superfamily N-acetyltransferase
MIRRATAADQSAISRVFVSARDQMAYVPPIPDDVRPTLGRRIMDWAEVWIAEGERGTSGFLGLREDVVTHLYVEPSAQNRGIGGALLDHAKNLRPKRLELWVFQKNEGGRRFYERHGFRLVRLTDGADNMEHEPDALYEWRPTPAPADAA